MASDRLSAYLSGGYRKVPGFATRSELHCMLALSREQLELGVAGNLAEVGVFHGRTLVVLAMLAASGESVVGVDAFDARGLSEDPSGGADSRLGVERNLRRYAGRSEHVRLLQTNSLELDSAGLVEAAGGPCRLVHVDGGHDYATVRHDLALAAASIAERGVVVMDDTFSARLPEVTGALVEYVRDGDSGLRPFLLTPRKTWLARPDAGAAYRERVSAWPAAVGSHEADFLGARVWCWLPPRRLAEGAQGSRFMADAAALGWRPAFRALTRRTKKSVARRRRGGGGPRGTDILMP